MEGLIMAAQFILALMFLVGIHEMGHLLAAKAFGMRVEKFSIGFPPKIFGFQWGETEYTLGLTPLGGYVKISGMVDESLDTDNLDQAPKEYEFRGKPAWQRLIVMLAGIAVNLVVGIIIFIGIVYTTPEKYLTAETYNELGIYPNQRAKEYGFQEGDKILEVNGDRRPEFSKVADLSILLETPMEYRVDRNGEVKNITVPSSAFDDLAEDQKEGDPFIQPLLPFQVEQVSGGAKEAGLQQGDKIVGIDQQPISGFQQLRNALKDRKNEQVPVTIDRDGQRLDKLVTTNENAQIGVSISGLLEYNERGYTFPQAIRRGTKQSFEMLRLQTVAFGKMFTGDLDPSRNLQGPIAIAKNFGPTWNWTRFWFLTSMLSLILAFMNLLPIPALDGGHVVFLLYEMVSGSKPSLSFQEGAQKVGMILLLLLIVFVWGNDFINEVLH